MKEVRLTPEEKLLEDNRFPESFKVYRAVKNDVGEKLLMQMGRHAPIWIGDVFIHRDEPERWVSMTPFEGPWMRGEGHKPGQDYRSPTDEEWEKFRNEGVHLRPQQPR